MLLTPNSQFGTVHLRLPFTMFMLGLGEFWCTASICAITGGTTISTTSILWYYSHQSTMVSSCQSVPSNFHTSGQKFFSAQSTCLQTSSHCPHSHPPSSIVVPKLLTSPSILLTNASNSDELQFGMKTLCMTSFSSAESAWSTFDQAWRQERR